MLPTDSTALLREFRSSQTRTERTRALTAIATGAILYLLFVLLDQALYPAQASTLLAIRLFAVSCMVLGMVVVARAKTYWGQVIPSALTWTVGTGAIGLMCHATEGFSSPYWAGIPLCGIAATIFTWPPAIAAISFALGLMPYYAPLLLGNNDIDQRSLALTSAFILSTFVLALIGLQIQKRLAFRAFLSHRQLEQSHAQLAELDKSKNRMFQNVSHELRTPLTLILSPLRKGLELRPPRGIEPTQARVLYRNGLRLLKQVDDLLALARLSSEGTAVHRAVIDLNRFLEDLVDDARTAAEARGILITTQLQRQPLYYSIDSNHFERIVLNLLSNAIKFARRGDSITISCRVVAASVEIVVSDTGPGIDLADQTRIFDRFEQASGSISRAHGGAGIGLALVRELTLLLGGDVHLESAPDCGARFSVLLPPEHLCLEQIQDSDVSRRGAEGLEKLAQRAALHRTELSERIVAGKAGPRVLIAEDDLDLRAHLVDLLSNSCRIVAVSDGKAALAEALGWKPHLLITDVTMPRMDGVELCSRLRQEVTLAETAVLMLTARTTLEDRVEGRRVGADSYLTKPFETAELEAAVEGLLRARHHLVGDFLIRRPLGSGGQSRVFLAEHCSTGRLAAIKRLTGRHGSSAEQLWPEVEALTRLDHPNIVKILGGYEQEGQRFLAMEYLSGTTLTDVVKRETALEPRIAACIGARVASALEAVHFAGLLHRDVKCSNVMLLTKRSLADGVRLIDFGCVELRDEASPAIRGTFPYMAPELAWGTSPASPASDIYSLGVTLFKACTGELPYSLIDLESVRQQVTPTSLRRVSEIIPNFPAPVEDAIGRAMAFDPAQRWQSAGDLAAALESSSRGAEQVVLRLATAQPDILTPTDSISSDHSWT